MIDTHAHLSKRFCPAAAGLSLAQGVKIILAASNLADSRENVELAKQNIGQFWASVGVHPQCTDPENTTPIEKQLEELRILIDGDKNKNVVAIGETGLDFSPPPPDESERSPVEQERLFRGQVELAQKNNLPLIIHARKAADEVIKILAEYKHLKGVFHCYAGGKKRIKKVLDLGQGWYFGIDGNLTYEVGLSEVVAAIPKDRLLAETDSPFLAPLPYRGQTNKPEYVEFIYKKIAKIWTMGFEETEEIIDKNAANLFNIVL
ncbi:MAG: TatD family hydrolase [Candidatus Shapirobacteria bacterium]|jgi:TatD DNase family protein